MPAVILPECWVEIEDFTIIEDDKEMRAKRVSKCTDLGVPGDSYQNPIVL